MDKVWRRRPRLRVLTASRRLKRNMTGRDARSTRRRGRLHYFVNGRARFRRWRRSPLYGCNKPLLAPAPALRILG